MKTNNRCNAGKRSQTVVVIAVAVMQFHDNDFTAQETPNNWQTYSLVRAVYKLRFTFARYVKMKLKQKHVRFCNMEHVSTCSMLHTLSTGGHPPSQWVAGFYPRGQSGRGTEHSWTRVFSKISTVT